MMLTILARASPSSLPSPPDLLREQADVFMRVVLHSLTDRLSVFGEPVVEGVLEVEVY